MSFGRSLTHPLTRSLTRLISRGLIAVLLLQVALPSWAALGATGKSDWIEICAAGGIQWVKLSTPDSQAADHETAHDHCLLCASTGGTPEFDARVYLHAQLRDEATKLQSQAPQSRFEGHSILSRAPPA